MKNGYGLLKRTYIPWNAIEHGARFMRQLPENSMRSETCEFDSAGMRLVFHRMRKDASGRPLCNLKAIEPIREGSGSVRPLPATAEN